MATDIVGERIVLHLKASDEPLGWRGPYLRLEVWRSATSSGPFEEITAAQYAPPRLPPSAGGPPSSPIPGKELNLTGMGIVFLLNEERSVPITFTGPDPITLAQAAAQVNLQSLGLLQAYVDSDGVFVVEAAEVGRRSILRVEEGDAATLLGLSGYAYGKEARPYLIPGREVYEFADPHTNPSAWYRTRLRGVTDVSGFTRPVAAKPVRVLPLSDIVIGTIDLIDAAGNPVAYRAVAVDVKRFKEKNGSLMVSTSMLQMTDLKGHAEFSLARGAEITVVVGGTKICRDVTVPTDPSVGIFRLLDPEVGSDDHFRVQVPDIDYAVRRST